MDLTYSDLHIDALNTPVSDWRLLFNYMLENGYKTLFDAGAGHARSAILAQSEFKEITVYAYELVSERIRNLNCPDQIIVCADLFKVAIPKCDITFLYLPTGPLLERILSQLEQNTIIAAVESHGELFLRLEESAIEIDSLSISARRHHPKLKIYKWKKPANDLKNKLRELSYKKTFKQIHIQEDDIFLGQAIWSADIEGLTITPDHYVETLHPPRRIKLESITAISEPEDIELIERRRLGHIRKIFIKPYGIIEDSFGVRSKDEN